MNRDCPADSGVLVKPGADASAHDGCFRLLYYMLVADTGMSGFLACDDVGGQPPRVVSQTPSLAPGMLQARHHPLRNDLGRSGQDVVLQRTVSEVLGRLQVILALVLFGRIHLHN